MVLILVPHACMHVGGLACRVVQSTLYATRRDHGLRPGGCVCVVQTRGCRGRARLDRDRDQRGAHTRTLRGAAAVAWTAAEA